MNKITPKEVGSEIFEKIIEDVYDVSYNEHRRGSNFFRKEIYLIDAEFFPELDPSFYGFWESDTFIHDTEYGRDGGPSVLKRVVKKEKTIIVTSWCEVETIEKLQKQTEEFLKPFPPL